MNTFVKNNSLLLSTPKYNYDNLILVYDTDLEPTSLQVSVPLNGVVNCSIDWGDGSSESHTTAGFKTHTYAAPGVYVVQVSGTMTQLTFGLGATANNRAKLVRCLSFGDVGLTSLYRGFGDCRNLVQCPATLPASVTTIKDCFARCESFNDSRVGEWNTSAVTDMTGTFFDCASFNADLSEWDTGAATSMWYMFYNCSSFNADLSAWDTSGVTLMGFMFFGCSSFAGDLSAWNTAAVTNMRNMFTNCSSFNSDLSAWDTGAVQDMRFMFTYCPSFNADLSAWDTGAVIEMDSMFYGCSSFNADLSAWNTAAVTNMSGMFGLCSAFDADLSAWDLSAINAANRLNNFMIGVTLSTVNYDALLIGWEANKASYRTDLSPHFGNSKYTAGGAAAAARDALEAYGWAIIDGGPV